MAKRAFANGKHDLQRGIDFVGVTITFLCHDGKGSFLLHKRSKNCRDEQGRWDSGAGALEHGEAVEDALKREIKEEYGVEPKSIRFIGYSDIHRKLGDGTPTHWIAIRFAAVVDPKKAKNNEPFKIDEIGWFTLDDLPTPLHSQMAYKLKLVHELGII